MAIYQFDDFDDLIEEMQKAQKAADESAEPWQAAIRPGDYVARAGPRCLVYSEILPDPEPRELGMEHYRFTKSYSVFCPTGELGDIHVSRIERKLTEEEFDAAKKRGWR